MKITKIINEEVEKITDVLCNKCGKSCKEDISDNVSDFYGLLEVRVSGGYYSSKFKDGRTYIFSICEKCLMKLFKSFKILPEVEDLNGFYDEDDEDAKYSEFKGK